MYIDVLLHLSPAPRIIIFLKMYHCRSSSRAAGVVRDPRWPWWPPPYVLSTYKSKESAPADIITGLHEPTLGIILQQMASSTLIWNPQTSVYNTRDVGLAAANGSGCGSSSSADILTLDL